MIIDIGNPQKSVFSSFYCLTSLPLGQGTAYIVGADKVLHGLISARLAGRAESFTPAGLRRLYSDIPGHYALILAAGDRVTVATDPYGIIKLYCCSVGCNTSICDSPDALRGASFTLDRQAVKYYFVCKYTPARHTFFEELSKLQPCSVYEFGKEGLKSMAVYAEFGGREMAGAEFLESYYRALSGPLSFYRSQYPGASLFMSGGIDSSFLFRLLAAEKMTGWADLLAGGFAGLGQDRKIDNDFDLDYAARLAADGGRQLSTAMCDLSAREAIEDFLALQGRLFTEFSSAVGLAGFVRSVDKERIIINGQNADSVLSFGSMGRPRLARTGIKGLNGFFSRYFYFFGEDARFSPIGLTARLLRNLYYLRSGSRAAPAFTELNYFLGIGLNPDNAVFHPEDPVFGQVEKPCELAEWFRQEYLGPLGEKYGHLSHFARSMILYNWTYMQGAANRATVLSALMQGRGIFLPYTSLQLLELMTALRPDWRYAFYGKYPNVVLGRRLGLPGYIIERCDPDDSDSSALFCAALVKNRHFAGYVSERLQKSDWALYEGILTGGAISRLQRARGGLTPENMPLALKAIWFESQLKGFSLR